MEKEDVRGEAVPPRTRRHIRQRKFASLPSDRSGLAGIAVAALVLALAAFFSGAWMGKAMSDLQKPGPTGAAAKSDSVSAGPGISGGDGAGVQEERFARSEVPKQKEEVPKPKGKETDASEAKELTLAAKGKPQEQTPPKPAEVKPAPPPKARYTLQVAALHSPEEARELVARLRGKGYSAYQVTGTAAAKGTLYRVRFGQFQSFPEARQSALEFEKKEKMKTIIKDLQ